MLPDLEGHLDRNPPPIEFVRAERRYPAMEIYAVAPTILPGKDSGFAHAVHPLSSHYDAEFSGLVSGKPLERAPGTGDVVVGAAISFHNMGTLYLTVTADGLSELKPWAKHLAEMTPGGMRASLGTAPFTTSRFAADHPRADRSFASMIRNFWVSEATDRFIHLNDSLKMALRRDIVPREPDYRGYYATNSQAWILQTLLPSLVAEQTRYIQRELFGSNPDYVIQNLPPEVRRLFNWYFNGPFAITGVFMPEALGMQTAGAFTGPEREKMPFLSRHLYNPDNVLHPFPIQFAIRSTADTAGFCVYKNTGLPPIRQLWSLDQNALPDYVIGINPELQLEKPQRQYGTFPIALTDGELADYTADMESYGYQIVVQPVAPGARGLIYLGDRALFSDEIELVVGGMTDGPRYASRDPAVRLVSNLDADTKLIDELDSGHIRGTLENMAYRGQTKADDCACGRWKIRVTRNRYYRYPHSREEQRQWLSDGSRGFADDLL